MADNSTKSIGRDLMNKRIELVAEMVDSLADKMVNETGLDKQTALDIIRRKKGQQIDYLVASELDTIYAIEQIIGDKAKIDRLATIAEKIPDETNKMKAPDYTGEGRVSAGKEINLDDIEQKVQNDPSYQSSQQLLNRTELGDKQAEQEFIDRNNARKTKSQIADEKLDEAQREVEKAEFNVSDNPEEPQQAYKNYEEAFKAKKEAEAEKQKEEEGKLKNPKESLKNAGPGGFYEKGEQKPPSNIPSTQSRQSQGNSNYAPSSDELAAKAKQKAQEDEEMKKAGWFQNPDGSFDEGDRYNHRRGKEADLQNSYKDQMKKAGIEPKNGDDFKQSEIDEWREENNIPMSDFAKSEAQKDAEVERRHKEMRDAGFVSKNGSSGGEGWDMYNKDDYERFQQRQDSNTNKLNPEEKSSNNPQTTSNKDQGGRSNEEAPKKEMSKKERKEYQKNLRREREKQNQNDKATSEKVKKPDSNTIRGLGDIKSGAFVDRKGLPVQIGGKTILPGFGGTSNRDAVTFGVKAARGGITNVGNTLQTGGDIAKKTGEGIQKKADELGKNKLTSGLGKVAGGITNAGEALQDAGKFVKSEVKQAITRAIISAAPIIFEVLSAILVIMMVLGVIIVVIIALCHAINKDPRLAPLRAIPGIENFCKGLGVDLSAGCDTASSSSSSSPTSGKASKGQVMDASGVAQNALFPDDSAVPNVATKLLVIATSAKEGGTEGNQSKLYLSDLNRSQLGWFQQADSESNVFQAAGTDPSNGFLGNDQAQLKTFLKRIELQGQAGNLDAISKRIVANGNKVTDTDINDIVTIYEKVQISGESGGTLSKVGQYIKYALQNNLVGAYKYGSFSVGPNKLAFLFGQNQVEAAEATLLSKMADIFEKREGAQRGEGFAGYNNPGNITYDDVTKKKVEAKFGPDTIRLDSGGRFAAFKSYEIGRWALEDYISDIVNGAGPYASAKTWGDIVSQYAPASDNNDTANYIKDFESIGLKKDTPISEVRAKLGLPSTGNSSDTASSSSNCPCPTAQADQVQTLAQDDKNKNFFGFGLVFGENKVLAAGRTGYSVDGKVLHPVAGIDSKNNGAYSNDTGLDILVPMSTPVIAGSSGTIVYSERGHTPWGTTQNVGVDTPNSVLVKLDQPIVYNGVTYYYQWYTHLSELAQQVPDGGSVHINQGDPIGKVGLGNKVPHLHFGMLVARNQNEGEYMPSSDMAVYMGIDENGVNSKDGELGKGATANSSPTSSSSNCNTSSKSSGDFPGINDPSASVFPITNAYEGPGPQQSFGACRGNGGSCPHKGVDLTPPYSISDAEALQLPILAFRAGKVESAGGTWNEIYIAHDDGTSSIYLHNSKILVKPGDTVKAGQIIALMGNAGLGEGGAIHLHFQLWDKGGTLINPAGVILDSSNQPNKANLKTIGNPQSVGSGF